MDNEHADPADWFESIYLILGKD